MEEFQPLDGLDVKVEVKEEVAEEFKKNEIPTGEADDDEHPFIPTSSCGIITKEIETVPITLRLTTRSDSDSDASSASVEKIGHEVSGRKPSLPTSDKVIALPVPKKESESYVFGRMARNLLCNFCARSQTGICKLHRNNAKMRIGVCRKGPESVLIESVKCKLCPRQFKAKCRLEKHLERDHYGHKCDICPAACLLASHLKKHKALKHLDWRFKCEKCNHQFTGKTDLINHQDNCLAEEERVITGPETASVPTEESAGLEQVQILKSRSGLEVEQEVLLSDSLQTEAEDKEGDKRKFKRINRFKCPHCPHSSKQRHYLDVHIDACHNGIKYPCRFCGRNFSRNKSRIQHHQKGCPKLVVTNSSKDDGSTFNSFSSGEPVSNRNSGNLNLAENKSGSFTCPRCHMKCASNISLRHHIRVFHKTAPSTIIVPSSSGESKQDSTWKQLSYSFECHICNEKFQQSEQLRNHLPIAHGGDQPQPEIKCEATQEIKEECVYGDIN